MGDQKEPPTGPDFLAGVPAGSIADGALLAGRVGDDAVVLARVGGRCYAIGASCTHYGAPLADGLIVGETIRCPWHHTAFSLRTGAAERPPAIDSLPCWRVEESGGRVRVLERIETAAAPERPTRRPGAPESVVIIGGGAAGVIAADTLRREGYAGPITIVEGDAEEPVDRPNLSKDYLAGNAPDEWMPLRPASWFTEHDIELRRGARAAQIDVRSGRVRLGDGTDLPYGTLLLATGSSPIRLPLPSTGMLPMLALRTLADSRAIIRAATDAGDGAPVVVIGASFIGLEVAASLRAHGLDVHVVAPEARPLERLLGPAMGDWIRRLHEEHGVVFHLCQKPRELVDDAVVLESGDRLPAAFVVAGVGVRPNVELAEAAGLHVDRGIVVNEMLETSAPGVFAAGDVARYPDPRTGTPVRVEHWVAAERQAQCAARNMLGRRERFEAVPFFWSAHYDATVAYVGHAESWDTIEIDGSIDDRDCTLRYRAGDATLAVVTVGRDIDSLTAEVQMEALAASR